jgi:ribosomal protein L19E
MHSTSKREDSGAEKSGVSGQVWNVQKIRKLRENLRTLRASAQQKKTNFTQFFNLA